MNEGVRQINYDNYALWYHASGIKWVCLKVPIESQSESIDQFLAGVERRAFKMARIATQDTEEALDLVQDAMFKLVQRYRKRDDSEWGALFYRILQHRIHDWQRRKWVRDRWRAWFPTSKEEEAAAENPIETFPDRGIRDEGVRLDEKKALSALENALHDLPLRQRQAFLLRAWEGYNVADAALAMGCSGGSVKTHYSRAVRALRQRLEEHP